MTTNGSDRSPSDDGVIDPHAHPSVWEPRLRRMIDRQIVLYEELIALTGEQEGLIEREEGERLLDLLKARQQYVDEVAAHNESIEPFVTKWESLSVRLDAASREHLSERLAVLLELVDRMVSRDERGRQAIISRRERLAEELSDVTRNKTAVNSYAKSGSTNPPRYQDKRA